MPQSFAHISSCSKSACSFWWPFAVLIVLYSKQSSANNLIEDVTLSGRSFMWQRNSIGPSTMPWGTPESTVVSFDFSPSTIVRIDLAVRKFVSHLKLNSFDIQHAIIDVLPGRTETCKKYSVTNFLACGLFVRTRSNSLHAIRPDPDK